MRVPIFFVLFMNASAQVNPAPTILAQTRFTIDVNSLSLTTLSDDTLASVGGADDYGDSLGSLKSIAVLWRTPDNANGLPYDLNRVDLLLYVRSQQANANLLSNCNLVMYADDGSASRNPGSQVRWRAFIDAIRGAASGFFLFACSWGYPIRLRVLLRRYFPTVPCG
jgi:hypothetical protein